VVRWVGRGVRGTRAALYLIIAAILCAISFQASASRVAIDIARQSADKALVEFARQAGVSVFFPTEHINQVVTNAVRGQYEVKEALAVLLRNTGLTAELGKAGVLTVKITDELGSSAMQANKAKRWLPALLSTLAAAFIGHSAVAQEATGTSTGVSAESSKLEEIVVTARRREENLQTVPIAVTALSQQTLQANNTQTLADLQYLAPSLSSVPAGYKDALQLTIRGQGQSTGGPGVVLFINEVPFPANGGTTTGGPGLLFDLENVQVLKGPQGTLFGLNSMGGDVLLQTARPTKDFGGYIQASYGNHDNREINGAVNIPLVSDVLLARVAFTGQWRDGYSYIQSEPAHPSGTDADNRDTWSVRGTVTFRPTESFQNDLIATYSKYQSVASPYILVATFPNGPAGLAAFLPQQQAVGIRTGLPIDVNNLSNGINSSLNNITSLKLNDAITFRNIVGYSRMLETLELDQDGTTIPILDYPSTPQHLAHARQFTEEAQLQGKALADRLNWVAGVFYLDNIAPNWVLQAANVAGFIGNSQQLYEDSSDSKALYAQGTYEFLPRVKFTGGLRYTEDHRTELQRGNVGGAECFGPPFTNCDASTQINSYSKSHALTWTAGFDYQVVTDTLLYLKADRGYRGGGFNVGTVLGVGTHLPSFGPEFVTEYEFGVKSDWEVANVPIRTNADVYYQDYSDIQVRVNDPILGPITGNAAKARIWGAELEATANLTDNLQVGINFDHLNRQYTEFSPDAIASGGTQQLIASETLGFPANKYGLTARYRVPVASEVGDVSVRANWSWQSANGDYSVPDGLGIVHPYGLLNMSVDWNEIHGKPFDLSLFASNLLNKDYIVEAVPTYQPAAFGYGTVIYGEPRMYGLRVRYRFGADNK
jgi:iron complex outermembrane receptor protein